MENFFSQNLSSIDVLNILVEQHRLFSPYDPEAEADAKLDFNSSIQDWRDANDLLPSYELCIYLNERYNMSQPYEKWKEILEPAKNKKLKGVCDFIAKNSRIPSIFPKRILNQDCLSAAVFLELKRRLEKRKIHTNTLRPSSLLAPYLSDYYVEIISEIILISKGKRVFEYIHLERKRKGIFNIFNLKAEKDVFQTEDSMQTFKDLILKILQCANFDSSESVSSTMV